MHEQTNQKPTFSSKKLVQQQRDLLLLQSHQSGSSITQISQNMKIPYSNVSDAINRAKKINYFKTNRKMGRPKKYTSREQKAILPTVKKDPFTSANEIKILNNLKFSSKTVSRVLKNNNLQYKIMKTHINIEDSS